MGARWSGDHSSERSMHSATSSRVVQVLPMRGLAKAEQDLRPILTVHGFVMSPFMDPESQNPIGNGGWL